MENKIFKVLHAYHPNNEAVFEKADILLYRDALVLSGYEKLGSTMSSFIHYQFHDLQLPGVYSTQIQLAEGYIPEAYKKAEIKNVFHCESKYAIVPKEELSSLDRYQIYSTLHTGYPEKVKSDDLDSIGAKEYYEYPFRVYNDLFFTFENANFYSFHRPAFEVLKRKSMSRDLYFVSIKTKSMEVIAFRNGQLLLCNSYPVSSVDEMGFYLKATLSDLGISTESPDIFITCVMKEEKDRLFSVLRQSAPNFNQNAEAMFGFPLEFWDSYGDLILCN